MICLGNASKSIRLNVGEPIQRLDDIRTVMIMRGRSIEVNHRDFSNQKIGYISSTQRFPRHNAIWTFSVHSDGCGQYRSRFLCLFAFLTALSGRWNLNAAVSPSYQLSSRHPRRLPYRLNFPPFTHTGSSALSRSHRSDIWSPYAAAIRHPPFPYRSSHISVSRYSFPYPSGTIPSTVPSYLPSSPIRISVPQYASNPIASATRSAICVNEPVSRTASHPDSRLVRTSSDAD